jgi:hypothetical protein
MIGIARRADPGFAPTTPGQRTDWRIHHARSDKACLNIAEGYTLSGPVDKNALTVAVDQLVTRHEALRTRLVMDGTNLGQLIEQETSPIRPRLNVSRATGDISESGWLSAMVAQPFDLSTEVPVRMSLLERGDGDYLLAVVLHHIVSDRMSLGIAMQDLAELIAAQVESRAAELPSLPVQFPDYAAWYQSQERSGQLDRNFAYWQRLLAGAPEATAIPGNPPTSPEATSVFGQLPISAIELRSCARELRTTPYVVLFAMFCLALAELTGADDQIIGCAYANRYPLRHSVGRLVNQLPLRLPTPRGTSLTDAVLAAHEVAMGAYANAVVPLDAVLERGLTAEWSSSIPFTNIALQLHDDTAPALTIPGVKVQPVAIGSSAVRRDLNVAVVRSDDKLNVHLDYRPSSIAPDRIRALADGLGGRLDRLVDEVAGRR